MARFPCSPFALPALLALLAGGLAGCAPVTPYRYSALTPAARPVAWDGRPSDRGSLRVDATLAETTVRPHDFPQPGDTALHVPKHTVDGAATIAVTNGLEIGARFSYAAYAWSTESATGTQPLPNDPSLFGWGPEVRLGGPLDDEGRWKIGFAGNLVNYAIPYAAWELGCGAGAPCANGYRLADQGSEHHLAINLGVYPSVAFGPRGRFGALFAMLGGHTGYKNDGFATTAQSGSSVKDTGFIGMFGMGYGGKLDVLRLAGMLFVPFTSSSSPIDYGAGALFTVGLDVDLFGHHDDDDRY